MKYLQTHPEKCIGCRTCEEVCSKLYFKEVSAEKSCIQVLDQGGGDFDLSVCNQCRACVAECPTMALTVTKAGVVMLNKNLCIGCYACVAVCPTGTMRTYAGGIIPFKCIACGACARECPTAAIEIVTED